MSDDQPTEPTVDEADTQQAAAKAGRQGHQTLEKKTIKGQVITHTIVKPLPGGGQTEG
ncbi:hypothetical protein OHU17_33570 [Streptomyces goshikiensis]|uniref:Uncharacterized protein n=1 Tax=Streptomyces goshikiensis TaxID=1942 RepID=A0ABZ1RUY9_9ACTN|nr:MULTISPECIES: hypothetical protein [Streptomyces]